MNKNMTRPFILNPSASENSKEKTTGKQKQKKQKKLKCTTY